jgi:hypothetical protein
LKHISGFSVSESSLFFGKFELNRGVFSALANPRARDGGDDDAAQLAWAMLMELRRRRRCRRPPLSVAPRLTISSRATHAGSRQQQMDAL